MAAAGLGDDLLLANESLDLGRLTRDRRERRAPGSPWPSTPRRPSPPPPRRACPRCSSTSTSASPAAAATPPTPGAWPTWPARRASSVRGVMGYEGHLMREPGDTKADLVERSMARAARGRRRRSAATSCPAAAPAPGTPTPGSPSSRPARYCLMDTEYTPHASDFENALFVQTHGDLGRPTGWGVLDAGLKAFGMDHGDPTVLDVGDCWFVSDEHITFGLAEGASVAVGDRVRVHPGPRRPDRVAARAPPPRRRRRGARGVGRRPPRLVTPTP